MSLDPREGFFDSIAHKWDGWEDQETLAGRMDALLVELGVEPEERVVDMGCGTGNLTSALLRRLGPGGRVEAVDISPGMLGVARSKVEDPRVAWHLASAAALPLRTSSCDRVLCYAVWPHFDPVRAAATEITRVLKPKGRLHVVHGISRERVNAIHASAGEAVRGDVLPPGQEVASLLRELGFQVERLVDTDVRYLVTAVKGSP